MRFAIPVAAVLFGSMASTSALALDEKEIMLRMITTVDICYTTGDADKLKMLAFGAGIDLANLTADQKAIVQSTKTLYKNLPNNLKTKVCSAAKDTFKDFP